MISDFTTKQSLQSLSQGQPYQTQTAPCPITPSQIRFVGQVESLMTRHAAEGDFHFVLLALSDGLMFRGKWRAASDELLPRLGDVIHIETEPNGFDLMVNNLPSVNTANQLAGKACCLIKNWQVIPAPYPLEMLDQLYCITEQPETLDRLWGIIQRIPVPILRSWLSDLFANTQLSLPFAQVPASHNHHHSHAGGLLLHSVECAEWVEQVATRTLNPKEAALSVIAALLHDFGKIETMNEKGFSQFVSHEVLSLTLLEPSLITLQAQWPQGAYALRQMLSWSTFSEKFPKFPGALLVKMADQYSTSLSARNKAFHALPEHYYWARLKTSNSVQMFNRIN
ncbi:putative helicase [Methylobacter tundripaludum]|uniref:Putative helicase n=1 Tax=Methylobacter tundripaludum TaxID=173365 RepID=A0A2S6H4W5_9GAMM|nr:HD domain-containing protein [Methylobacter tundripaludum]PPK72522.1 putative helicase [Methylobacter tundripaludum]